MNPVQRAALKAKVSQKPAKQPTIQPPPQKPATPKPELVTYACGHSKPIEHIARKNCGACKQAAAERQASKKKEKKPPKSKYTESQRLPDGSVFCVDFIAEKQEWHGHLHIGGGGPQFEDRSSGVFRLLQKLDAQYRENLQTTFFPNSDQPQ